MRVALNRARAKALQEKGRLVCVPPPSSLLLPFPNLDSRRPRAENVEPGKQRAEYDRWLHSVTRWLRVTFLVPGGEEREKPSLPDHTVHRVPADVRHPVGRGLQSWRSGGVPGDPDWRHPQYRQIHDQHPVQGGRHDVRPHGREAVGGHGGAQRGRLRAASRHLRQGLGKPALLSESQVGGGVQHQAPGRLQRDHVAHAGGGAGAQEPRQAAADLGRLRNERVRVVRAAGRPRRLELRGRTRRGQQRLKRHSEPGAESDQGLSGPAGHRSSRPQGETVQPQHGGHQASCGISEQRGSHLLHHRRRPLQVNRL